MQVLTASRIGILGVLLYTSSAWAGGGAWRTPYQAIRAKQKAVTQKIGVERNTMRIQREQGLAKIRTLKQERSALRREFVRQIGRDARRVGGTVVGAVAKGVDKVQAVGAVAGAMAAPGLIAGAATYVVTGDVAQAQRVGYLTANAAALWTLGRTMAGKGPLTRLIK